MSRHQALPQQQQQQQQQRHRTTKHRDGFSTSICDLFSDPSRRSDCCALVGCGAFLSDRTHHLLLKDANASEVEGMAPPTWRRRLLLRTIIPIGALLIGPLAFLLVLVVLLCYEAGRREKFRKILMRRMDSTGGEDSTGGSSSPSPHRCCPCWVPNDVTYSLTNLHDDDEYDEWNESKSLPSDSCTLLWKIIGNLCCGCVGVWCQCCGMCAVAQEAREMDRLTAEEDLRIDYVTFQPFSEYFGEILRLRRSRVNGFADHFMALSELSRKILRLAGLITCIVSIGGLLTSNLKLSTLIIACATFSQALFVLYFVYWKWNRFDISFDAVVKYFAAGSLIGFSSALFYELLVMVLCFFLVFILTLLALIVYPNPDSDALANYDGSLSSMHDIVREYEGIIEFEGVLMALLNSFVVAAVVEELTKYFCYWMVEHPDFMEFTPKNSTTVDRDDGNDDDEKDDESPPKAALEDEGNDNDDQVSSISLDSRASAITIAMVAAAAGFAFTENMEYIFTNPTNGLSDELITLVMRSLLPLHPIIAAIQSIGVIRRDVENDKSIGLGKIILPSFLIHGTYDFILMVSNVLKNVSWYEGIPDDDVVATQYINDKLENNGSMEKELEESLKPLAVCFVIVVVSLMGFFRQRRLQRARLFVMDPAGGSSDVEMSSMLV